MDTISGDWKTFEFHVVQDQDFPEVLQHLRFSFYKDEPTQIIVGMTEDRAQDLDNRITTFLHEKMSFMAKCKLSGKIAGLVIMSHCSKDSKPTNVLLPPKSPLTPKVRHFMSSLENSVNIFETFGVEEYGCIFILSVDPSFRGAGLATEMFGRGVETLRKMKYSVIESTFSNPFSRKVGVKFGFVEMARRKYSEGRDAEGNLFMENATEDQFVIATVLDLRRGKPIINE